MKNKSFCKKLLYILLMVMMLTLSLTACGEKDRDDDEDRKERKEKTVDDEEDDDEEDEEDEEKEDEPEETPEPTPEPTAEPKKWRYAYSDFFEGYGPLLKENISVRGEAYLDGIDMTLTYAYSDKAKYMTMLMNDKLCEMYSDLDKLYFQCDFDDEWLKVYAPIDANSADDIDQLFLPEVLLKDIDNIIYRRYLREAEEDGIIYDVLKCVGEDSGAEVQYYLECYVDREKQELAKIDVQFDNSDVLCWEISYLSEREINNTVESIADTLRKNGNKVSMSELRNTYADFLDMISGNYEPKKDNTLKPVNEQDWDTYYESYFDEAVTFPDSYALVYNLDMYGISIDFRSTVINGETWIRYGFGESTIDAYFDDSILLVGSTDMDSVDWALAYLDSAEQVDDIFNMDFWGGISGQIENVNYIDYIGSEEINDTVYDVVEIEFADDTPGQAYINREKQSIYKFSLAIDGMEIEFILEDYDPIRIPYAATEAKEVSVDEISDYFMEIVEIAVANSFMY